jgi:hypothetical protein
MSTTETKKTESPKTDASAFAAFTTFPQLGAFDPMAAWSKLVSESLARMTSFADHYAGLETQMMTRAQGAVASWAQMSQDAIAYGGQLSAEARKLGFEAWKKLATAA